MAIPQPPQSSAYPPAPQRGEQGSVFVPKANAFVAALEPRRQELQNLADYTYERAVDAEGFATAAAQSESNVQGTIDQAVADATAEAEGYAGTAQAKAVVATSEADRATIAADRADQSWMAASNFKGRWSDLTGALSVPSSVAHDGNYWMLLADVGDVTASEPGPGNTDWQLIAADSVRRALLEEATLYADFANGDYRLYEGIGGGLVRNKAFSDLFTFTRNSAATGWGASALETVTADVARFVYSPEVKKRAGLAIEKQRTRLNTIAAASTDPEDVTVTADPHTISFFGAGTIDLTGVATETLEGTGADDRVTLTFTPTAGTLTITPSGTVTDLQLEAGSFATSVIRGEGSQVTRAADICYRTLGAEFNPQEATIYAKCSSWSLGAVGIRLQGAPSASNVNTIDITGDRVTFNGRNPADTSNVTYSLLYPEVSDGEPIAFSFDLYGAKVSVKGQIVDEVSYSPETFKVPSVSDLRFGRSITGQYSSPLTVVEAAHIVPRALSAAELEALTAP